MEDIAKYVVEAAKMAESKQDKEIIGNILEFKVGIKGNTTLNVSALNMDDINLLDMIEGLAVLQLSLMSSLVPKGCDQDSDPIIESLKAFEATKRELIIQSFMAGGMTRASEVFNDLRPLGTTPVETTTEEIQ